MPLLKMLAALLLFVLVSSILYADTPPPISARASLKAAVQSTPELDAKSIVRRAHKNAGGEQWRKPHRLKLSGYNIIRRGDQEILWDRYSMWREYADSKTDAHTASGKVRIEAWEGDRLALLLAFDGEKTYNQNGAMPDQTANAMWGNNFGYGAIRNALDEGWTQTRQPDDMVDGQAAYMIQLNDPAGGQTLFGIRQSDYAIVSVGFETQKGWHERRYSNFFSKPDISWKQPGRVRLFYNGVKANEAIWLDFDLSGEWSNALFRVSKP